MSIVVLYFLTKQYVIFQSLSTRGCQGTSKWANTIYGELERERDLGKSHRITSEMGHDKSVDT